MGKYQSVITQWEMADFATAVVVVGDDCCKGNRQAFITRECRNGVNGMVIGTSGRG